MRFETTIEKPLRFPVSGCIAASPVRLRTTPAPAGTGIVFRRSDLEYFAIPASWKHVARVSYATSLMRQGVLISNHRTSAEHAVQLRHRQRFIEIDNLEVPILDGSGQPFVDLLREAGVRNVAPQTTVPAHPPPRDRGGGTQADLDPARGRVPAHVRDRFSAALVGKQSIEMEVTPERYAARTVACAHVRLREGTGPDARDGFDPRRLAWIPRSASLRTAEC